MTRKYRELWIVAMLAIAGIASGGYLAAADMAPHTDTAAPVGVLASP